MIINNTFRFIFVHIPKCGGTSVSVALSGLTQINDIEVGATEYGQAIGLAYHTRFGLTKHATARQICKAIGYSTWMRYYSFALVRNPYRRAISTYTFLKTHENDYKILTKFHDFNAWVQAEEWQGNGIDEILCPQHKWLADPNRARLVDDVFHLEDVIADIKPVLGLLGLSDHQKAQIKLGHDNRSYATVDPNTIEDRTIDLIRTRYAEDFALFGYPTDFSASGLAPGLSSAA